MAVTRKHSDTGRLIFRRITDDDPKVIRTIDETNTHDNPLGIPVRRDDLVSVVYSTELNATTSFVPPQRTDRYGILDDKPPTFQRLSG